MKDETKAKNLHVSHADGKPPVSSSSNYNHHDDDYDDYDDYEEDDDPMAYEAERCTCGAYKWKNGRWWHVSDCCC